MTAISMLKSHHIGLDDRVSLITQAKYRYEGTVNAMNMSDGTLSLRNVTYHGAENRKTEGVDQNSVGSVFDSITFWINNIVDLKKLNNNSTLKDSAVVRTATSESSKALPPINENYQRPRNGFYKGGRNQWRNNTNPPYNQSRFGNSRQYNSYKGNRFGGKSYNYQPRRFNGNGKTEKKQSQIDCTKPYDFEAANAELEKEMAKLSVSGTSTSVKETTPASGDSFEQGTGTGNNVVSSSGQNCSLGDSNDSVQTSEPAATEVKVQVEAKDVICYNPKQSFFDRIGRAFEKRDLKIIPPPKSNGDNVSSNSSEDKHQDKDRVNLNFSRRRHYNRRERALNRETFGMLAAKLRPTQFLGNGQPLPSGRKNMVIV